MKDDGRYAAIKFMRQMLAFGEGEQHYRLAINALRRSQDHTAIQTKCNALAAESVRLRRLLQLCVPSLQRDGRPHIVRMVEDELGDEK